MATEMELEDALVEVIRLASTTLPPDQIAALKKAAELEPEGSMSREAFEMMLKNAATAAETSTPTCQDTGALLFHVHYGPEYRQAFLREQIATAAGEATRSSYLRPNAVDSHSGKNSGDNTGLGSPYIHFEEQDQPGLEVKLMLKGGGSENMGRQYTVPDSAIGAGRDLEGVRKCVIDAVFKAQGFGCAPGVIGVGVGGDRMSSFLASKESLFRTVDDTNPNEEIAALEAKLLEECNSLGIGPMGFGGKTSIMGVKIGFRHRLPASYFVSISYMCWANRKAYLTYNDGAAEFTQ
ncbi:MAG: fumarate hydratase [Myxococcota bacterium]|nr:fumarate hydratase [Myxococcota bacterium]